VSDVNVQIATILEPRRLLQDVVDLTKERFALYHSHIYLLNEEGDTLQLTAGAGHVGREMVGQKRQIALENVQSIVATSGRERKGVIINDTRASATFLPHPLLPNTRSEMAVPLISRGQLLGVLDVQSDQPGYFTQDVLEVFELLALQIATAISNARLYDQADRTSRHDRAITEIDRRLQGALGVDEILQTTVRELGKALRVPYTAIELKLPKSNGEHADAAKEKPPRRTKMTRKSILWVALLALLLLVVSGAASAQTEARATSVQLSWFPNIEYAGLYEAERNGFFTAQGLTVELKPGGFDDAGVYINPVDQVMNGNAEFGITGAHVILSSRAEGKPLVAIAAIYQRTPVVLFSLPGSNINRPEDLVGKRVGTQPDGSAIGIMFRALLASKNLTMDQIVANTSIDFNSPDPLFSGEVDVMQGFLTNQAVQARLRDPEVKIMLMSDYGIDFYSNVLFTTTATFCSPPSK